MDIFLYNTLTRTKEKFAPLKPGLAQIYTCGPTVYGRAHIGNLRAYVFADTLCRVLRYNNYQVEQIMNITDVGHLVSDADEGEDKMAVAAREQQKSPWEIAEAYTELFNKDCERLKISPPMLTVKATDCIPEMIEYVQILIDNGYAYEIDDGIYFDISRLANYGYLSRIDLDSQQAGARVAVNVQKKNPHDFAVWKRAEPEHIMQWESPWGMGYPGWHMECSAISDKYFGKNFDIHTGGIDHIPIHHENEIAQSFGKNGVMPANYWMHSEFIQVDKGKMSKSLRNTYSLDDLIEAGYQPAAYRYLCLNGHYSKQINFTWEGIKAAQTAINRLRKGIAKLPDLDNKLSDEQHRKISSAFLAAINDDLNIPKAMAVLWDLVRGDFGGARAIELIEKFDQVLALGLLEHPAESEDVQLTADQIALIKERNEARKAKNWARADQIRQQFFEAGIELIDTGSGTKCKYIK